MKSKDKRKRSLEELIADCKREYASWNDIHQNGCRDPCHADGVNLNLVRNHIIYTKEKIKEYCEQESVEPSPILLMELPPQVASDFMANAESIKENAKCLLTRITELPEFTELTEKHRVLSDGQRKDCGSQMLLSRVQWLHESISRHEYVVMRRFLWQEEYLVSQVSEVLAKAKTMVPEAHQLTLFDDTVAS